MQTTSWFEYEMFLGKSPNPIVFHEISHDVYVYIYVCLCVCTYVNIYIYVYVYWHIYIYNFMCIYNYIYSQIPLFVQSVRTHRHVCVCVPEWFFSHPSRSGNIQLVLRRSIWSVTPDSRWRGDIVVCAWLSSVSLSACRLPETACTKQRVLGSVSLSARRLLGASGEI